MGFYKIPEHIKEDMARLKKNIELFKKGELSNQKFKAFRVPMGIYEQRKNNIYMMRIRIAGGGVEGLRGFRVMLGTLRHGAQLV